MDLDQEGDLKYRILKLIALTKVFTRGRSSQLPRWDTTEGGYEVIESDRTIIVGHEELLRFSVECFGHAGFGDDKANLIGRSLVEADLRGLNTHGVLRIPMYLNRVKRGLIDPQAEPVVVFEKSNIAVIDAGNGMGQPCSCLAMKMAIEKALSSAVAVVGVRNSNHFGAAAYYTMMAAEQKLIGICSSNTEPLMTAPGGAEAVVGNNPFSLAIPVHERPPIVLDMATSVAALGKIMLAEKRGESIPPGWAIDHFGNNTTDPSDVLAGGFILPVGGPKGYGLSLMIDILSGILTGSGFGKHVKSPLTDMENNQRVGHLFAAVDIRSFLPINQFNSNLEELLNNIKEGAKATGVSEVFLPGEIEFKTKQTRLREGIPLPVGLIRELEVLAGELGLTSAQIRPYALRD